MIKFENLTIKNFMSCGNKEQTISLDEEGLTLVLGENLEFGGGGSRNGVGKSTILQAIHFALFGISIENKIKKDNLINKTNEKSLLVGITFTKHGKKYEIVRTRKPNSLQWFVDDNLTNNEDEAEGENKDTQEKINEVLGFSPLMACNIFLLNTISIPFLMQPIAKQREFIEELLGISLLSQKAQILKSEINKTKDDLLEEETKIKTLIESNNRIEKSIKNIEDKSENWKTSIKKKINTNTEKLKELYEIDIDQEIKNHEILEEYKELKNTKNDLDEKLEELFSSLEKTESKKEKLENKLTNLEEKTCPTCEQPLNDGKHESIVKEIQDDINSNKESIDEYKSKILKLSKKVDSINSKLEKIGKKPTVHYRKVQEAYNHQSTMTRLLEEIDNFKNEEDPYISQIEDLKDNSLQEIDYEKVNYLTKKKEHQELLLKLLTSKDSFIRKKIIDQNLGYLNKQLETYLDKLSLTHNVQFMNDLSVRIRKLGQDFDFDSLSTGEKRRLMLALSFSFRDMWESMNNNVNLLMVDEMLDNGLDSNGVESSLNMLKYVSRDLKRKVFLISHREELISRVSDIMMVRKEDGFTSFDSNAILESK